MGAPQITVIILLAMGVGTALAKFGQQKTDNYDIWDVAIGPAIVAGLLWWGGFWH